MRRKDELGSNFGGGVTLDPDVVRKAAKAVALGVPDVDEARLILDMLGIIPPQPGYEIINRSKEASRKAIRLRKDKKEEERLERNGVTPEEIGE